MVHNGKRNAFVGWWLLVFALRVLQIHSFATNRTPAADTTKLRQRHDTLMNVAAPLDGNIPEEEEHGVNTDDGDDRTLPQDWALIDQVPLFTVGEGPHVRTFWTQLAAATTILSEREPEELYERCRYLQQESVRGGDEKKGQPPLVFGHSPPVLQYWQLDGNGQIMGETQDGRTILLRYVSMGRLQGDPFSDVRLSASVFSLVPGGYLEAISGRIYELGQPNTFSDSITERVASSRQVWGFRQPTAQTSHSPASLNDQQQVGKKEDDSEKSMAWWLPASTATVSALLASTVLSACIGYGAGLSIITDESGPHYSSTPNTARTTSSSAIVPVSTSPRSSTRTTTSTTPGPSLDEQRARTEYRVLREQRLLQQISDRLEKDQLELKSLQHTGTSVQSPRLSP